MPTKRIPSIDQFRGFAILTMVLANYMGGVMLIPAWLKHAPDIGLTVIDLIAPFFIFVIGLTYGLSFQRRLERDGAFKTYSYFLTRYLAIIGLGAIISAGETAVGENPSGIDWGVLQAIGMAGLVTLVVIRLPSTYRWLIGLGLLAGYQVILDHFLLDLTLRSTPCRAVWLVGLVGHADPQYRSGRSVPWVRSHKKSLPVGLGIGFGSRDRSGLPFAGQQAAGLGGLRAHQRGSQRAALPGLPLAL
jgi:uncharacterized membrane protein